MKNNSVLRKECHALYYWGPLQNYKQRAMKWSEIWHHKTLLVLCELINLKHCPSLAMCVVYVCIMWRVQGQLNVNMALNVWII